MVEKVDRYMLLITVCAVERVFRSDLFVAFDEDTVLETLSDVDGNRVAEEVAESELDVLGETLIDVKTDILKATLVEAEVSKRGVSLCENDINMLLVKLVKFKTELLGKMVPNVVRYTLYETISAVATE